MSTITDMPAHATLPARTRLPHPPHTSAIKPSHAHALNHAQAFSSRPGTPSRGDITRKSHSQSQIQRPHSPVIDMNDRSIATPSPRPSRRKRGNQPSHQRSAPALGTQAIADGEERDFLQSENEDELFDLLNVVSPPRPTPPEVQLASGPGLIVLPQGQSLTGLSKDGQKPKSRRNKKSDRLQVSNDGESLTLPRMKSQDMVGEKEGPKNRGGKKASKPLLKDSTSAPAGSVLPSIGQLMSTATKTSPLQSHPKPVSTKGRGKMQIVDDSVFETSSLSQSLPADAGNVGQSKKKASRAKKERKEGGHDSAAWEVSDVSGNDTLTWQQRLAQTETPTRPGHKPQTERQSEHKPKSRVSALWAQPAEHYTGPVTSNGFVQTLPRPAHARRVSHESPLNLVHSLSNHASSNGGKPALPISAFDDRIPFHTGFNVHRAPQTPAKSVASANGNLLHGDGALPIIPGEFPRIREAPCSSGLGHLERTAVHAPAVMAAGPVMPTNGSGGRKGEMKYAGPTFHNSPHAGSLSKPDLDDF